MIRPKILLIEDSLEAQLFVKASLNAHFDLSIANTLQEANNLLKVEKYAAIIIDIELPDGDGLRLFSEYKDQSSFREALIIFLTSRNTAEDRVAGYSLGADDFITKPIDAFELLARLQSRLAKNRSFQEEKNIIKRPPFYVDLVAMKAWAEDSGQRTIFEFTTIGFKLFRCFLMYEGQILTRDQIIEEVWGKNYSISIRVVDTHMYQMRKAMGDYSNYIKSVFKSGYRFKALKTVDEKVVE